MKGGGGKSRHVQREQTNAEGADRSISEREGKNAEINEGQRKRMRGRRIINEQTHLKER